MGKGCAKIYLAVGRSAGLECYMQYQSVRDFAAGHPRVGEKVRAPHVGHVVSRIAPEIVLNVVFASE